MYRYIFFLVIVFAGEKAFSQSPIILAEKQAQRIKDTLQLTEAVKQQLYNINIGIITRKQSARETYKNNPTQLRAQIQLCENQRDSLYKTVIVPDQKYLVYLQKKTSLLSAN